MSNSLIKRPKPKKQRQKAKQTKHRISLFGFLSGLAGLIGVIGVVVAFVPRLNVTVSDPVDPNNPFSASVTIANTGYVPLDLVEPFLGLRMMEFGVRRPTEMSANSPKFYTKLGNPKWHPGVKLGFDDKFAFGLDEIMGIQPNLSSADIAIIVQYQIPIIGLRREKVFPLVAKKQSNDKIYWYAKAP